MHRVLTFAVPLALVLAATSCTGPFEGRELVALHVDGQPTREDWERAVPLVVKAWMGNVHERPEIVALDRETTHRSTPQCHHGPSESEPVEVRLQALFTGDEVFVLARWEDRTRDTSLGRWEKAAGGWAAAPDADDGIAIMWGPEGQRDFRCQNTCHMVDVDVFDGSREMRMRMMVPGEKIADLWRWRSRVTAPFGVADDMVVDRDGQRGDEGQVLTRENRPPEIRGNASSGEGPVPFFLVERPRGDQAQVRTVSSWERGWWTVLFQRRLVTGDGDDRNFSEGDRLEFSVGVFDNTFREHHVVKDGLELRMGVPDRLSSLRERELYEPLDY